MRLTREEFQKLMDGAFVRYSKLPEPDQEFFDAASYLAGLEHGYRERRAHPPSAAEGQPFVVLCFSAIILLGIGFLVGFTFH